MNSIDEVFDGDDFSNNLKQFQQDGTFVVEFGNSKATLGKFFAPTDVAYDSTGKIYVLDNNGAYNTARVQRCDADGTNPTLLIEGGTFQDDLDTVTVDPGEQEVLGPSTYFMEILPDGNIYDDKIYVSSQNWIQRFDLDGKLEDTITTSESPSVVGFNMARGMSLIEPDDGCPNCFIAVADRDGPTGADTFPDYGDSRVVFLDEDLLADGIPNNESISDFYGWDPGGSSDQTPPDTSFYDTFTNAEALTYLYNGTFAVTKETGQRVHIFDITGIAVNFFDSSVVPDASFNYGWYVRSIQEDGNYDIFTKDVSLERTYDGSFGGGFGGFLAFIWQNQVRL